MKKLVALILFCLPMPLLAQGFDYNEIDITVSLKEETLASGATGKIEFTFTVPYGYSLTTDRTQPGIKILNKVPFSFGSISKPEPHYEDAVGGHYVGEVTLTMPVGATHAKPGDYEIVFGFVLQACEEGGMCFFPTAAEDVQKKLKVRVTDN